MTSPSPDELARGRYREQQTIARAAAAVAGESWAQVDQGNIAASWTAQLDGPLAAVTAAQQLAAAGADGYLDEVLAAQDLELAAAGAVAPARFAGIASDGRPLASLLYQPAIQTLRAIGAGATPAQALQTGRLSLDMIVRTQVADAGRTAAGVGIAARGVGYVRQLNPPSCSRCAILAGRFYRWNTGFKRHPRCDCIHFPTTRAAWRAAAGGTPRDYFASLNRAEQDRIFTKAGAEAIRDGADMSQVVNARRGMTSAGTTTESTTRRGVARPGRLMPEEIYRRSKGDRQEALRLLELHGYLVRRPVTVGAPALRKPPAPVVVRKPPAPVPVASPFTKTTLTKADLDVIEARRDLTFAEARLRRATTDAERQAAETRISVLQERVARSGTKSGYNWSSPSWRVPAGSRVAGAPDRATLASHIDRRVGAGIPAGLRGEMVTELERQAALVPRAVLELRGVEELSKFDTFTNGDALAYYDPTTRRVSFHPKWETDRAAVHAGCNRSVASGWWSRRGPGRGAAEGTMAHEFGHHVAFRAIPAATYEQTIALAATFDAGLETGGAIQAAVRQGETFNNAVDDWLDAGSNRSLTTTRVSHYGSTNAHELAAEIWHEYSTGDGHARPHIQAMGRALHDLSEGFEVVKL